MTDEREALGRTAGSAVAEAEPDDGTLLGSNDAARYLRLWDDIQTGFVDDPRSSVAAADSLVKEVIGALIRRFDAERESLEDQWRRGEEASTEDLRRALQAYRTFCRQLLET